MYYMFCSCHNFNQPITFDTSNVTDMTCMFYKCHAFNQPIEFDTSKVINMSYMFDGCNSLEEKNKQLIIR